MAEVISTVGALAAAAAAIFSFAQARLSKRQAVAAEENADVATRQAAAAEEQAKAAKVQADLSKAQLEQLRQGEDEEAAHKRWIDEVVQRLRLPEHKFVLIEPGDRLHAQWALARGYVEACDTASGPGVVLPLSERRKIAGSPEAKILADRQLILKSCAEQGPNSWCMWQNDEEHVDWETFTAAAEELSAEGLVACTPGMGSIAVQITVNGLAAARRGSF